MGVEYDDYQKEIILDCVKCKRCGAGIEFIQSHKRFRCRKCYRFLTLQNIVDELIDELHCKKVSEEY